MQGVLQEEDQVMPNKQQLRHRGQLAIPADAPCC